MANIKPLRALRYNPEIITDMTTVISPPYDVLSVAQQKALHDASIYNILHLELGEKHRNDSENYNVYTRVAAQYQAWQKEGVLLQEEKPALYLYQQEFQIGGKPYKRTGFIAGIEAAGYGEGKVLPHEETLPKHKADRLELMRHTMANFSPIFGLYSQPERTIEKVLYAAIEGKKPEIEVIDQNNETQRIWVITDAAAISTVMQSMSELTVYIADGHHRYETACTFAAEMAEKGVEGCTHIMMSMVNLYDEGLTILPTHRLMKNIADYNTDKLLAQIAQDFEVSVLPAAATKEDSLHNLLQAMEQAGKQTQTLGFYAGNDQYYLLKLTNKDALNTKMPQGKSAAWRALDVSVLHSLIIEPLLGVGPKELAAEGFVHYTRNDADTISMIDDGTCQCAFLMNATKMQELLDVAEAGEKMPQKATYFYPKLLAGLLVNKMD